MKILTLARPILLGFALFACAVLARANPVLDWNQVAFNAVAKAGQSPVNGVRTMAAVHAAMFDAVNAIEPKYQPYKFTGTPVAGSSADAAAAAAAHRTLAGLFPDQKATFDEALAASLAKVPAGVARDGGSAVGVASAETILAWAAADGFGKPTEYRPVIKAAGVYVPTTLPASDDAAAARPWLMTRADQFRPGPPPALTSATWARDFEETRTLGARIKSPRTAEQTEVARFWVVTGAPAFNGIIRQAVTHKDLPLVDCARATALTYLAFTDALIGVFEAKYTYNFWRPITAVRNADLHEGNSFKREAGWLPLVDAPMHPEYPCAHCVSVGSVATVLQAIVGDQVPLTMQSPTLPGVTRQWTSLSQVSEEVQNARIWSGVHYRNSSEVGAQLGRNIAQYALANYMKPR